MPAASTNDPTDSVKGPVSHSVKKFHGHDLLDLKLMRSPRQNAPGVWSSLHEKSTNVGWRCPGSVRAFSLSLRGQLTLTEVRRAD